MRFWLPIFACFAVCSSLTHDLHAQGTKPTNISWKRIVLDKSFRSEGVAVADVNKDGRKDILVGDFWYEAPKGFEGEWKAREIRKPGNYGDGAGRYSDAFACWADDINRDGWPDLVVVGFPGKPCHWYENPQGKEGHWKQHVICNSACNETPQYVDLFGNGKRVLVMGYQDKQIVWVEPTATPTEPWVVHSISDPAVKAPGSNHFAHGLGIGDVNGDGRADVMVTQGWFEQPSTRNEKPWVFHPASISPDCADMYALDVDGDGKADVVSSSAHNYGFWWSQQKPGKDHPAFVSTPLFPSPSSQGREPSDYTLSKEEKALYAAVNKSQSASRRAPLAASAELCRMARDHAERLSKSGASEANIAGEYKGKVVLVASEKLAASVDELVAKLVPDPKSQQVHPRFEVGVGFANDRATLILGDRGTFSLPGQTHALCHVDIDGDGVKDFITGRRWWAHGPKGDASPADPAYLFWFKGKRDSKGFLTFEPREVDDDSGIGTQFTVEDVDGDGIPDIVVSNKRGVYVFLQTRAPQTAPPQGRRE